MPRSFKVKRFTVAGKPINQSIRDFQSGLSNTKLLLGPLEALKHFMTLHDNIGFNSKGSEELRPKLLKKMPALTTSLSFEAPSPRNPCKYLQEPYSLPPESRVSGLHFAADYTGL